MPAGAHQHSCANLAIDQPGILLLLDAIDLDTLAHPRTTSVQQKSIKFAASYAVADRFFKGYRYRLIRHAGDLERGNRLKDARAAIFSSIDVEQLDDRGRDPAGAHLVAREIRTVKHDDIQSRALQCPRA